jgi:hypothetical protein
MVTTCLALARSAIHFMAAGGIAVGVAIDPPRGNGLPALGDGFLGSGRVVQRALGHGHQPGLGQRDVGGELGRELVLLDVEVVSAAGEIDGPVQRTRQGAAGNFPESSKTLSPTSGAKAAT